MKGMSVYLEVSQKIGEDGFGQPIYDMDFVEIKDALVGSPSTDDITSALQLYGKRIQYVIGIPKGDAHNWEDKIVKINGKDYKTFGFVETGIQENIPLRWGGNIKVERYGKED